MWVVLLANLLISYHSWRILLFCLIGTRFRPLSLNIPKPLFPLAGQPMVHHPISACKRVNSFDNLLMCHFKFSFFWVLLLRFYCLVSDWFIHLLQHSVTPILISNQGVVLGVRSWMYATLVFLIIPVSSGCFWLILGSKHYHQFHDNEKCTRCNHISHSNIVHCNKPKKYISLATSNYANLYLLFN